MTRAFIPVVIAVAQITSGHRVLDVATGTRVAQATARGVNSSAEVVAGDVSATMLDCSHLRADRGRDGSADGFGVNAARGTRPPSRLRQIFEGLLPRRRGTGMPVRDPQANVLMCSASRCNNAVVTVELPLQRHDCRPSLSPTYGAAQATPPCASFSRPPTCW